MRKNVIIVGLVGLLIGLFVYDYFILDVPIISLVSFITIIIGVRSKSKEQPLPTIKIPQKLKCTTCGAPIHPGHKFCTYCGNPNPYNINEPLRQTLMAQSIEKHEQGRIEVKPYKNLGRAYTNLFLSRSPMTDVSNSVYEKLDPVGIITSMRILLVSAILFVSFYIMFLGGDAFNIINSNLAYFIATYSVSIIYFIVIYRTDKYEREPFKFILFVFVWGVFCGIIAAPLNELIGPFFQASLGNASLIGAFTEEPLKAAGFYYLVTRKRFRSEFNTPLDGIVYGFAAGMGFFAMENFIYYLNPQVGGSGVLIIRSFLLWGHGVWVATTGLWLAIAKTQRGYLKRGDLVPGLAVAITMHFLWNGWMGFLGADLGWIALILQLVFQFWYMRKIIREALRDEVLWGYGRGKAPVE